jgi:acyl-CoA synthetase (AMP-forming)/AMP-acid ligase II
VVPKTSSGKLQRRACRAPFLDGTLDTIAISSWVHPAAGRVMNAG